MYLFGGRGTVYAPNMPEEEVYSNELWYLDLNHFEWHLVCANGDIPIGRRSHSACKEPVSLSYCLIISFLFQSCITKRCTYSVDTTRYWSNTSTTWTSSIHALTPGDDWTSRARRHARGEDRPAFPSVNKSSCSGERGKCWLFCFVFEPFISCVFSPNPKRTEPDEPGMIDLDEKLVDHSDMYVLDFKPTLKTLSMIAVKSSNQEKRVLLHTLRYYNVNSDFC